MKLSISDLYTYSSIINSKILEIIEKINPQKSVGLFYPYKNEVDVLKISNDFFNFLFINKYKIFVTSSIYVKSL